MLAESAGARPRPRGHRARRFSRSPLAAHPTESRRSASDSRCWQPWQSRPQVRVFRRQAGQRVHLKTRRSRPSASMRRSTRRTHLDSRAPRTCRGATRSMALVSARRELRRTLVAQTYFSYSLLDSDSRRRAAGVLVEKRISMARQHAWLACRRDSPTVNSRPGHVVCFDQGGLAILSPADPAPSARRETSSSILTEAWALTPLDEPSWLGLTISGKTSFETDARAGFHQLEFRA